MSGLQYLSELFCMLVRPGISEMRMLGNSSCRTIVISDWLLISTDNIVLRFINVYSGTAMMTELVLLSLNTGFGGLVMFSKYHTSGFNIVHYLSTTGPVGKSGEKICL